MQDVDDEGYLVDPEQWTEDWAAQAAARLQVPLLDDQGFGIAFSTYDGGYHAGLVADWDIVPGLETFAQDLRAELDAVCEAAATIPRPVARAAEA